MSHRSLIQLLKAVLPILFRKHEGCHRKARYNLGYHFKLKTSNGLWHSCLCFVFCPLRAMGLPKKPNVRFKFVSIYQLFVHNKHKFHK